MKQHTAHQIQPSGHQW